jgi:ABC-type uncharacterized transport system involved in gliding motility auxiliary subunit
MDGRYRHLAPLGLYVGILAGLISAGLYFVQPLVTLPLQIGLALTVIGLAAFIILDPEKISALWGGRQARYGSNAVVMFLGVLGILVVVNYLAFENPQSWDLTEDQTNTLAPETLETLASLEEPVTALAFFTSRSSSDQARQMLDLYRSNSDGNFNFSFIDPEQDPIAAQAADITRDRTIVLRMGDRQEQINLVTESEITGALVRLMSEEGTAVYFLTGHGEPSVEEASELSYTQVKSTLEGKNYTVAPLNLVATGEIPEDAKVIMIAAPEFALTSDEIDLLTDFVDAGNSLMVMIEPTLFNEIEEDNDPLGDYLESDWGIVLGDDIVVDQNSQSGFAAIAAQYGQSLITQRLESIVTVYPTARSVQVAEQVEGVSQLELVLTAPFQFTWAETDLAALEAGELEPNEEEDLYGPVTIAVTAERFADNARLVVFGDADFANDSYITEFANRDMIVNSVDWAAEQENLINLTPKDTTTRFLLPPQQSAIQLMFLFSVIVFPGALLVSGIVVWVMRRRRG